MPHGEGERDLQPEAAWLRVVRATVSRRTVAVVVSVALLLAVAAAAVLVMIPRAVREQWLLEAAMKFLASVPPTDAIIAQLPPARLESVRARGLAQISRLLTPGLLGGSVVMGASAVAYAWCASKLRVILSTLTIRSVSMVRWPERAPLIFAGIASAALLVHVPYALQSVRFDEDFAGVYASSSWFAWANNLAGYQNHVAALFTIRLSTALFGLNELSVRAPAILAASLALALMCTYLWSRFSPQVGLLTAALFISLPLWAEQTTLARGYGLTFLGGSLLVVGLLRLEDEEQQPSSATMACVFAGVFIGSLAHAFFAFLSIGVFAFTAITRQLSPQLRAIMLWWLFLAGFLPALSMIVGMPGMLVVVKESAPTPVGAVAQRFAEELTYRRTDSLGMLLMALWLCALASSAWALPARARTFLFVALTFALLGPVLFSATYVYPRYYLHTTAFTVPCVAWFVSTRVLRGKLWANAALVVALLCVWCSTQPWKQRPTVDLRAGAQLARAEAQAHGERFAIDTFLVNGMRFYNGATGRIANVTHPIPGDVQRLLLAVPHVRVNPSLPEGFAVERRIDGSDSDILLLGR